MKEALEILLGKNAAEKMIGNKDIYKLLKQDAAELRYQGYTDEEITKLKALSKLFDKIRPNVTLTKGKNSQEIVNQYAEKLRYKDAEELWLISLNNHNEIISEKVIATGKRNSVYVDIPRLLREALKAQAHNIILMHNHPQGPCEPSPEDDDLTKTVLKAARTIGIELVDHIIISRNYYYSYFEAQNIINQNKRNKKQKRPENTMNLFSQEAV